MILLLLVFAIWFALNAGKMLVVDAPQPSDVIVVLAGETYHRPTRALELLNQGLAHRILLDVPAQARIYEFSQVELAEKYAHDLPPSSLISICPI